MELLLFLFATGNRSDVFRIVDLGSAHLRECDKVPAIYSV